MFTWMLADGIEILLKRVEAGAAASNCAAANAMSQ
jgi:hypothetical protein